MLKVVFSNNNLTQLQSNLSHLLNLMNPVSVKIGTYLDRYTAKVTLEHEGRYDETSMEILSKGARLRDAFCATCDVLAYDLDDNGDPDNCYMFKKPTSYDCSAYPDRIKVEIEFGELHNGPNIDKKCNEIEILQNFSTVMHKLVKEDFDKKSKTEGDDKMKLKFFFECEAKTYADTKFIDWLNSADSVLFTTDEAHKQYTLELRTPANFDLSTASMPCLNSLRAYVYEVSDKHPEPANCHKLSSIKNFDYKHESYSYYRIIFNFDKEEEGSRIDTHCSLKHFVDCISAMTPYTLDGVGRFRKDDFSDDNKNEIKETSKKDGDNVKHFSECAGMCITCASHGHCLAGIGDDDYAVADKAELIRRLKNDNLAGGYKDEIKKVLKEEYHFDYDNNTSLDDKVPADSAVDRISKHEYYLKIAEAVSLRGTCLRRKFGAIIVKDDRIVSTGYVGAPRGRINCCDRGKCYRMEHNVPSGQRYELCRSTHAEMNAIIQASPEEMKYATLYLVGIENDGSYTNADCCSMCKRVIINSGINTVIARQADGSFKKIHVTEWVNNDDSLDIDHEGY